jgi:hypothetical protein
MAPVVLAVLAVLAATGCVVGAERPPSRLELARAPSDLPSREAAALTARRGCPAVASSAAAVPSVGRPPPPSPGAVWIEGSCHSTSVQYEWVPGYWETRPPLYSWH